MDKGIIGFTKNLKTDASIPEINPPTIKVDRETLIALAKEQFGEDVEIVYCDEDSIMFHVKSVKPISPRPPATPVPRP